MDSNLLCAGNCRVNPALYGPPRKVERRMVGICVCGYCFSSHVARFDFLTVNYLIYYRYKKSEKSFFPNIKKTT